MQYLHYSMILILVLVATSSINLTQTNDANASVGLKNSVGIALSKNCVTMTMNNFTTNCPDIFWLYSLGLDTSDKTISGNFTYIDNYFQREIPTLNNHYRFYDYEKDYNIFIDPPGDMRDRIPMIFIENNFKEYKITGKSFVKNDNNTRVIGVDRYTNSGCTKSTIDAEQVLVLLPDTIRYMRSGCDPGMTNIQTVKVIQDEKTVQDISTSQKWKDEQRLQWIKDNCIKEYGKCNE